MTARQLSLAAPPHNNQQLFSDHYLDEVLPELPAWKALTGEARTKMREIAAIFGKLTPSANEAQTEYEWVRPVLECLGHVFEVQARLKTPDGTKTPDYVFYGNESDRLANKDQVLTDDLLRGRAYAVGDAKYWDRKLDVSLKGNGGDLFNNRNPSYQIAFYIQHSGADWGILTNGRKWRLYHRDSAYKLDRYYEVDLPALLETGDPARFLYFYTIFRRAAFEPGALGAAEILKDSTDYARGVSDKLKLQVFEALRHLAQGFLDYPENRLEPTPDTLAAIYDNALIMLYRLLFILYAEARELLPVHDNEDYRDSYSLQVLTHQIAQRLDHGRHLLPTTAVTWPRLKALFQIIDAGSPPLNVATFNGGLFDPKRHPFLERFAVGDAHLQQAIDILARVDEQFVDYRDLAEYHLGSIYEGLLEYHLIATPPRGGWTVDLENEKGERKRTGSYYTPNYIVKYIVEQTVGPILHETIEGKADDKAKAEAILSVNVLDPAMGSGYFLVEATEYIARFLVDQALAPIEDEGEPDLAYWKRRVAQSCIYGVDINPLAVDLAKLSLWLSTVARDRPLSFLDHHLRVGNSVVGARIGELQPHEVMTQARTRARRKEEKAAQAGQISMLDDDTFRRNLSVAVDSMWLIERTAGNTVAEVKQQEAVYAELRETLMRRYGRLADLVTATYFGLKIDPVLWPSLRDYAMGRTIAALPKQAEWLNRTEELASEHHFFHWELEFPEVFFDRHGQPLGERGGFDAVVGNPPYVRQERLKAYKPYFEATYPDVYNGTADLFVYFFVRGVDLLRHCGKLSYISSNSWLRADYATPFRAFVRTAIVVETIVDLGDNRVFLSAPDTYPAITTVHKNAPAAEHLAQVATFTRGEGVDRFSEQVREKLSVVSIHDQLDSGWQLGDDATRTLLAKLMAKGNPLGEVLNGKLYRGILTGLNTAFIIDTITCNRLVQADPSSAVLIKPILRGEDLRPWYQEDEGRWVIAIPSGWTQATFGMNFNEEVAWTHLCERHPALADYLGPFADAARKRQDKGQFWWELRPCDYYGEFENSKIMWPDIAKFPRFSWNESGYFLGNTGYMLVTNETWLLAVLASRCAWYSISQISISFGERVGINRFRLFDQYMRLIPVPHPSVSEREALDELAAAITDCARARYDLHVKTRQRILTDLGSPEAKLKQKLTAWWQLDFQQFRAEVRKVLKREIPLKERDEWEEWLRDRQAEHERYTAEIVRLETLLNARVYALFDLTPDEIATIEAETKYRYGEV